jgi:hypothetical protein
MQTERRTAAFFFFFLGPLCIGQCHILIFLMDRQCPGEGSQVHRRYWHGRSVTSGIREGCITKSWTKRKGKKKKKKKKAVQTDSLLEGKGRDREIWATRRGKAIESTRRGTTWRITQDAGRLGGGRREELTGEMPL